MIRLGLTGSIGMGKSTTAAMFRDRGALVHDADAAVAALYGPGGAAGPAIAELAAHAVGPGGVDRGALKQALDADPSLLARLEAAVHPLVEAHRRAFDQAAEAAGAALVVYDIPLLFEVGADAEMDAVLVVTAPPEVQEARVLARPGMTRERLAAILARQTPDAEKRRRADYIVDTSKGLAAAAAQVDAIIAALGLAAPIRAGRTDAGRIANQEEQS